VKLFKMLIKMLMYSKSVGGAVASWPVSALISGPGPGSRPGRGHCVVFLDNTPDSHSASLHPGVQTGTGKFNAGGNPAMD